MAPVFAGLADQRLTTTAPVPSREAIRALLTVRHTGHGQLAYARFMQTMTQEIWEALSATERLQLVDRSGLHPDLVNLEGQRIRVTDGSGRSRLFWVGRSTGWRPCHLEIKTRRSHGGDPIAPTHRYTTIHIVTP